MKTLQKLIWIDPTYSKAIEVQGWVNFFKFRFVPFQVIFGAITEGDAVTQELDFPFILND